MTAQNHCVVSIVFCQVAIVVNPRTTKKEIMECYESLGIKFMLNVIIGRKLGDD